MKSNLSRTLSMSYFFVILLGTILLKLPMATTQSISWIDALFTATSATTVTGLAVVSIGNDFTLFGQIVIICLMQMGGLGILTFAMLVLLSFGKKVGLRQSLLVQESLNQTSLGGLMKLVKTLLIFSFSIEFLAIVFLSIRWVPEHGWKEGIYQSIFHAVSAFNNAGLSLWDDSLSQYVGDPTVNLVITFLFIIGGIGFLVLSDIWYTKKIQQWSLHTKLMVVGTLLINLIGMLVIFVLEYSNPQTLGMLHNLSDKLWATYFQAVTPRTAGFNTLDFGSMNSGTLVFMSILMFIGAGSTSTGSGIKLSTFIVIVLSTIAFLKQKKEAVAFGRTIKSHIMLRSLAIVVISLLAVFIAIFLLSISEKGASFLEIVFEAFSAFGTVGLSMGLTGKLSTMGKLVIIVLMFLGRIGPLTLVLSFLKQEPPNHIRYPEGQVFTG